MTGVTEELISKHKITKAFKLSYKTLKKWQDPSFFNPPLEIKNYEFINRYNEPYTIKGVLLNQFWVWLQQHPHAVNPNRYVEDTLPYVPLWFEEKRNDNQKGLWYTQEDDEQILTLFYQEKRPLCEIAPLLGRDEISVKDRLIVLRKKQPDYLEKWKPLIDIRHKSFVEMIDENTLDYLRDNYGKMDLKKLAKKSKISLRMIEKIVTEYDFSSMRVNQGILTPNTIAKAFGICSKTVKTWSDPKRYSQPLPLKEQPTTTEATGKYKMLGITPERLWAWVYHHLDVVDLRKYEPFSIPPEPEWFYQKLKEQRRTLPSLKNRTVWSEHDDKEVWYLYYTVGLSQKEIAKRLDRSSDAVEKRIKRLREQKFLSKGHNLSQEKQTS